MEQNRKESLGGDLRCLIISFLVNCCKAAVRCIEMMFSTASASFSLLLLVMVGPTTVSALVGSLEPMDVVIEAGTDLTLNCTVDASSNGGRTAHDVVWSKYPAGNVSRGWQRAVSDTLSQLFLTAVTVDDTGDYVCAFPGDDYLDRVGSEITVGRKPEPAVLECFVPSPDEYRCRWEEGSPTNIDNEHSFSFMYGGRWTDCPVVSRGGSNECTVPLQYNTDLVQRVRVTSRNTLGVAHVEKQFSREADVVVNRPRNLTLIKLESETSLRVTWEVPDGWHRPRLSLDYKLRSIREGCGETDPRCCCWAEEILESASSRSLAYTLKSLDPYAVYSVQLAARYQGAREENWSEWSEEVTARTRETAPTETVQGVVVRYMVNQLDPVYRRDVHIRWTSLPVDNPNGRILGYKVILEPDDESEPGHENLSPYTWSDLRSLQMFSGYVIRVAAYNSADVGRWSAVRIPDNTTGPNPPEEVRAVAKTTTSVLVQWQEPRQPNGYILNYTVEWWRSNGNKQSYITPDASQLSHLLEDLETSALYEVGVKTRNSRGESRLKRVSGGARTLDTLSTTAGQTTDGEYRGPRPDVIFIPSAVSLGIICGCAVLIWFIYHYKILECKSNFRTDQEQGSWILSAPHAGVFTGLREKGSVEMMAEGGLQAPCPLGPIAKSDPGAGEVEWGLRSGSRDSGMPPSPLNDDVDFGSQFRGRPSFMTEADEGAADAGLSSGGGPDKLAVRIDVLEGDQGEGDGRRLPEVEGPPVSSPTVAVVGPYMVDQSAPSHECPPMS